MHRYEEKGKKQLLGMEGIKNSPYVKPHITSDISNI